MDMIMLFIRYRYQYCSVAFYHVSTVLTVVYAVRYSVGVPLYRIPLPK